MKLGSHNSMSYLKPQWHLRPFAWMARCQSLNIVQQFNAGARWFDLRIAFDKGTTPVFAHGLMTYRQVGVFDILHTLDVLAADVDEPVYVRLLNERDKYLFSFASFCAAVAQIYTHLVFTGGSNKKDWQQIYDFGTRYDMPLVDKYASCNHDNCEYDPNGNETTHVNNTGKVIDDLCPVWYAKRNNANNRVKYADKDVYLLLDFVGKY